MRFRQHLGALAVAASLLPFGAPLPADAQSGVPVVRGEVIRDFARVTFEWPRGTYLDASSRGNVVTLHFERAADLDFGALLPRLAPYVTHASLSADGKTMRLTLDKPYRVRSFVSGNVSGIDILGIDPALHGKKSIAAAKAKAPETPPPENALPLPPPENLPHPAAEIPPPPPLLPPRPPVEPPAAQAAALSPSAGEAAPEAAAEKPEPPAAAPEKAAEAEAAAYAQLDTPDSAPEHAAKPAQQAPTVKAFAGSAEGRTVLRFAWPERVAAAAFIRGGYAWIVFNKPSVLDLSALKETATALYPTVTQLAAPGATILRIPAAGGMLVAKTADSFEWSVVLVPSPQEPPGKLRVDINTEPPLPPHVFLPLSEAAATLEVQDPSIGDTLLIVPTYQPGQGLAQPRRFVEFALQETAQGVVVQKIADAVRVTEVRGGMRIGTEKGALITPGLPHPEQTSPGPPPQGSAQPAATLFPYEAWKADPKKPVLGQAKELERLIAEAPNADEANKLRLRLAQLYLAEGFYAETQGVLQEIKRVDPPFFVAQRLGALSGASNFMLYRYAEASQDFAAAELQGSAELRYWQSMLGELLGKPEQKYDYLAGFPSYFRHYPPRFQQRLAITAADRAIAQADYSVALQILATLRDNKLSGIEDYNVYLMAKVALETGNAEGAKGMLKALAENYASPAVRARAEFNLITHALKEHPENVAELQGRLERLNLSWRGDSLEMETLKILGELYSQQEDYVRAMKTWRDLTVNFPSTPAAAEAVNRMRGTFLSLFDNGTAAMPPLDQLSLYYEFRSLTPADETGDRIVNRIADRLVALDLLEQAITLLDYRMRYLYEKEGRSRTGARLARVYLLNRQPAKALATLENSVYGNNPADLRLERDRVAAQAMVELNRHAEALQLLAADTGQEADAIRQRSFWRQKDWPKLIGAVEDDIKNRPVSTEAVTDRESQQLVQLAMAYVAERDTAQLQYLRDYFLPLMKNSPREKLFDFLTEPDVLVTPEMFPALIAQVERTRRFLQEYTIRPPLSRPPAPPPPAAAP